MCGVALGRMHDERDGRRSRYHSSTVRRLRWRPKADAAPTTPSRHRPTPVFAMALRVGHPSNSRIRVARQPYPERLVVGAVLITEDLLR